MDRTKLISELTELMEVEEDLTEDTVLGDLDEWDSLSALSLIDLSKKEFDKKLTAEDIKGFKTVKDICDFLEG